MSTVDNIDISLPFSLNRPLQWMVGWLVIFWIATAIEPVNREDWLLENILVICFSLILMATYQKFVFTTRSYLLLTLFLTLHLIGAHYTYSETPFGFWMQAWFDFERNHFDRLVHFSFGFLLAIPVRELLIRAAQIKSSWANSITVMLILSMGGLFEVFEMLAAIMVHPELGDAYLGTQGDVWDAQQDMLQAIAGAFAALILRRYIGGR
ncbi:MAG: DUF2238 domain-containing protein [Gammaproteobacteria bacterium]|nr:DUF2238 domain-containing protein [Gammaproteobacteria bacterium]